MDYPLWGSKVAEVTPEGKAKLYMPKLFFYKEKSSWNNFVIINISSGHEHGFNSPLSLG